MELEASHRGNHATQCRRPALRRGAIARLAPAAAVAALTLLASTLSGAAAERQEPRSLTTQIRKTVTVNYLLYLPTEYGQNPSARWPLILFLHGAGERGSDLSKLTAYGPPKLVAEGQELPFIIVSPQVPAHARPGTSTPWTHSSARFCRSMRLMRIGFISRA